MLGGIFQKRKKIQELRAPVLQDIKRFREIYGRHADARHVEAPACFERSIYKAISCQKELHAIDFRQEDVTDPQIMALAETLLHMPLVSSLDLRDNRITDDGAKALLEVLRLQIIAAKTPPKTDPKTKKLVPPPPVPEFTRYVTNVNLKGNEISVSVLEEMAQYTELLKREDKRLEIRAALNQIDRNAGGGVDEDDFKAVVKLLTGTEPSKKEVKQLMSQSNVSGDNLQNSIALENVLLAKCSSSPSKKAACPPWEALVQVRHANIGSGYTSPLSAPRGGKGSPEAHQRDHLVGSATVQRSSGAGLSSHHPGALPRQAITQVEQVTMTTLSSAAMGTNAAPVLSPPPAPQTSSNTGLSISISDVGGDSSPTKPTADFRPPSSPPPPLPLPQTTSPDRRGTVVPTSSRTRDSFESSGDVVVSAPSVVSEGGASSSSQSSATNKSGGGVPPFVRQDSRESYRGASPTSPPSTGVSPNARDDYSMDFSSWRDEDPFGVDHEDFLNSPLKSPIADGVEEIESVKSQEYAKIVGSRLSMASSNRTAQIGGHGSGIAFPVVNAGEASDGPSIRGQSDLSSLVYNAQADSGNDNGREFLRAKPDDTMHERLQVPIPEPPVIQQEDEEEELSESVVLDIVKDGKPRNVAQVRHSEFKRRMALQDFPGDVPFRNLVALILSENGLRDLSLFKECRFPCTTVLDLSTNVLNKINDEELACFPKLQVLDLSCNRLRVISGVGKLFDLKALSLCNNQLRNVINIEHLIHLQILRLRSNAITAPSALRLLSLNKMLAHLDLDDNPLMETDDRQRRKVTVHILNIVPTLTTLGSVPIAGHIAKDKRKIVTDDAPMGKSLLEHDECPGLRSIWASNACDILQIVQDRDQPPRKTSYDEDDRYGDAGAGSYSPTRQKKPSREQQRQKDELRSKSVGYRSRGKAPPSPVRAKTSSFAFGPPLPPPQRKSPQKQPVVDPKRAQEQKRRASQLSEPKHPPVDPDQFKQEQRRKSRPTFDVNMSVAERLQLVRDKSQRRTSTLAPHVETGPHSHQNSTTNNALHHSKRGSDHVPALIMEIREQSSPARPSSPWQQRTLEFRVEPLPVESPRRPQENNQQTHSLSAQNAVQIECIRPASSSETSAERKSSLKESLFLQSLAVTDFLSHAEEEISTAHTALNVLLSMCERSPSDPKKLSEYRNSLDALDILDEHESQELYERGRHHDDPEKVQACSDAFEKLRTLKRCIKELLIKLESHAPGSATILSYCSELRSTELRDIIDSIQADDETTPVDSPRKKKTSEPAEEPRELPPVPSPIPTSTAVAQASPDASGAKTLHSRLFSSLHSEPSDDAPTVGNEPQVQAEPSKTNVDEDEDFDFLSSDTTMFDDDDTFCKAADEVEEPKASTNVEADPPSEKLELSSELAVNRDEGSSFGGEVAPPEEPIVCGRNERSLSATSTDITQDIQQIGLEEEGDFDFDSELPLEEAAPSPSPALEATAVDDDFTEAAGSSHDFDFDAGDDTVESGEIDWGVPATEDSNTVHASDEPEIDDFQDEADALEAEAAPRDAPVDVLAEEEDLGADAELYEEQQNDVEQEDDDAGEQLDSQEQAVEAEDEDDEEAEVFGDWEKGFDPNTNHYFWFNHETGESQWVPPEGWPYEVDTPFEEDAEQENEDGELEGEYEDQDQVETQSADDHDESAQPGSPTASAFEADDDVFSDQDLPDF